MAPSARRSASPRRRRSPRRRTPRLRGLSLNRILPNLMTLLALSAGLTAVRLGLEGTFEKAVIAILLAAVLDGLDGRVARMLNATSPFGAELDSLSDFVCFGVTPALLLYLWSLQTLGTLGWILALVFVACCGLRLARFNTQAMGARDLPVWAYNYFTGVPAPAGAGLALLPLILSFEVAPDVFGHPALVGGVLIAAAALMVSRLPTYSLKKVRIPHWALMPLLVAFGGLAALLITTPWLTLAVVGSLYVVSLPLSWRSFRTLAQAAREMAEERADPPP